MAKIAIVTGATGGIGREFVKQIASGEGLDEIWAVGRNESKLNELASEFASALDLADKAYVMDINYDREDPNDYPGIDAYTIINKLDNGDYIEKGMADKLLEYDNSVILFMSSKEIYILENEYEELLKKKLNIA